MSARSKRAAKVLSAIAGVTLASYAFATTYTDVSNTPTSDVAGGAGPAADISSVVITNDGFDLHVTINMNPNAALTSNPYAALEMGIQVGNGAGGQTAINGNYALGDPTAGNPYGSTVGIGTGENFFIGSNLPGSPHSAAGDASLYSYSTTTGWSDLYDTDTDTTRYSANATSESFFFLLSSFGFTAGSTFKFDVWSTFTSNPGTQGAYDALDNPNVPNSPTESSPAPWNGENYDSATAAGSTFSSTTYTVVGTTVNATWNVDGGGSWNSAGNWTPSVPNSPASTATFGSILDSTHAPAIITLDQSQTVGQLTFNSTNSYSITTTSGSSLTINDTGDTSGVNPLISAVTGSHSIAVPVFLSAGATLNAGSAANLGISGAISGSGPVTVSGTGTITLSGANTYAGNTAVNAASNLVVGSATAAGSLPATTVLTSNGTTTFAANPSTGILARTLAGLTLSSGGSVVMANPVNGVHTNRSVLVTGALSFAGSANAWQGLVNLNANDMIVQGGHLSDITNQLKEGFHGGLWNGTAGIVSAVAASDSRHLTSLGSMQSTGAAFDGVNTATSDVLIKYTYIGDANLDGSVNGADYQQIDAGYGSHLTGWQNGDFNYDGVVDGSDFSLIDNAFNQILASGSSPLALIASPASLASSAVPEPAATALLAVGALSCFSRRRRREKS